MQEKNDNPPPPVPPKKFIRSQNDEQPNVHEPHSIHTKQPDNPLFNPIASPPGSIRSKNSELYKQPTVVTEQNPTLTKQPDQDPSKEQSVNVISNSALFKCDKCQSDIIPYMEYKIGCCAVSLCMTIFLFGPIGFCLIPLFLEQFHDKHYKCSKCGHTLYVENRCCIRK